MGLYSQDERGVNLDDSMQKRVGCVSKAREENEAKSSRRE
jgi:hypothetical protein